MSLANLPKDGKSRFSLLLIFLFPILIATVKDAGSAILLLLFLISLTGIKDAWQKLENRERVVLLGLVVLAAAVAMSLLISEDTREGARKLERYFRLVLIIPVYLMLRNKGIDSSKVFLTGAFVACFVMLGLGLYQTEVLGHHLAHGAYHKIIFGDLAILFASLAGIAYLVYKPQRQGIIFILAVVLAGGYASLLSQTRAAWLFVPILGVVLLFLYRQQLSKKSWLVIGTVFILLAGLLSFQSNKIVDGIKLGIYEIKLYQKDASKGTSWGTRLNMWHNSWQIFKTAPLFGTGVGDYNADTRKLLAQGVTDADGFAERQTNSHSIYFQTLAEGGMVGIILLVSCLFILPLLYFYRHWQQASSTDIQFYSLAGIVFIVAFVWFGASEGWLNRNPFVNTYCILLAIFMTSIANKIKPMTNTVQ